MTGPAPTPLERVLARDRWLIGACLAVLVALAWAYLLAGARRMGAEPATMAAMPSMPNMPDLPGMAIAAQPLTSITWSPRTFALTATMWWVMMIGMMLPSATPIVLLFGGVQRRQLAAENPALRVAVFTLGYLVVWGVFSLLAASAQTLLGELALLAPLELTATTGLAVALVALAGIYQLTPLKNVCLRHCRAPAEYLSSHWRRGTQGALRMGIEHGAYCVGCCWLLMGLLFAVGVMNLLWVAALATVVLLEKLAPRGELIARGSGVALLVAAAYLYFGAGIAAAQAPTPAAQAPDDPAAQRPSAVNDTRADTPGTGRFPALKEEVASLPKHVVYRPADLAALGSQKLGVVAWGNGGCSDDGASSRFHLLELASHGYLVLASGRILSGPGTAPAEPRPPAQPGQPRPPRTLATELTDAIDWALAENQRSGGPFYGRIDPAQVALSGWSCGGLQALRVAKDPRVKTVVMHNTGVLNDGPSTTIPGMDVTKDALANFHTPVIYILGGPSDIAYANGMDDFARIEHVPIAVANLPVGHGGTFQEPNGGAAASVAVSWLDWQLRADETAARRFVGDDCGLCRDASWTLQRKNLAATSATR